MVKRRVRVCVVKRRASRAGMIGVRLTDGSWKSSLRLKRLTSLRPKTFPRREGDLWGGDGELGCQSGVPRGTVRSRGCDVVPTAVALMASMAFMRRWWRGDCGLRGSGGCRVDRRAAEKRPRTPEAGVRATVGGQMGLGTVVSGEFPTSMISSLKLCNMLIWRTKIGKIMVYGPSILPTPIVGILPRRQFFSITKVSSGLIPAPLFASPMISSNLS